MSKGRRKHSPAFKAKVALEAVKGHSIKELEKFFGFTRDVPLSEANSVLYAVSTPLELGCPEAIRDEHKEAVEGGRV